MLVPERGGLKNVCTALWAVAVALKSLNLTPYTAGPKLKLLV